MSLLNCNLSIMLISDISLWGVLTAIVLLLCVLGLFFFIDRKLMSRMLRVLVYVTISLVIVAGLSWCVMKVNTWWCDLIWVLLLAVLTACLVIRKAHLALRSFILPLTLSLLSTMGVCFLCMHLLANVSHSLFVISVFAGFAGQAIPSVSVSLNTYVSSLRHTQEHQQYLLANGASHVEAVLPSVRRSLRASALPSLRAMSAPILLAPPLLFCGLLMLGSSPFAAAVVVLILMITSMFVSVLTTLLTIIMTDRFLFDASGRLVL